MNRIEHLLEPERLWLVWQPTGTDIPRRTRRTVAEIVRDPNQVVRLRYLVESADFALAQEEGFQGFPAFRLTVREHTTGVLDAFMRRLPPRKREDFAEYLAMYRLQAPFAGSDFALLAYTGAKLPSDGFEIAADLSNSNPPLEWVLEAAGFRHQPGISLAELAVGDRVALRAEPDNPHDPGAIAIVHARGRIGYVSRPYCAAVRRWIDNARVDAVVDRLNGKPERPLIYVFLRVAERLSNAA